MTNLILRIEGYFSCTVLLSSCYSSVVLVEQRAATLQNIKTHRFVNMLVDVCGLVLSLHKFKPRQQ